MLKKIGSDLKFSLIFVSCHPMFGTLLFKSEFLSVNSILSITITPENFIANKKMAEIDLPNGSFFSLIVPLSGAPFIPQPESIIEPGHKIIVVTKTTQEQALLNSI